MSGYFSYGDIGYTPSSSSDIKLNHEVLLKDGTEGTIIYVYSGGIKYDVQTTTGANIVAYYSQIVRYRSK